VLGQLGFKTWAGRATLDTSRPRYGIDLEHAIQAGEIDGDRAVV
jgi:hypothetical protein